MTPRARIVRGSPEAPSPTVDLVSGRKLGRRVAREELEARMEAERILQKAQEQAQTVVEQARQEAERAARDVVREVREHADTELAARWLALRQREQQTAEMQADRVVGLATALAERLIGAAVELSPDVVLGLARGVLAEARGARRARIAVHPQDVERLRESLTAGGLDLQVVEVESDGALARGDLRLHTDLGTIDARLAPRFERLAAALRDALV